MMVCHNMIQIIIIMFLSLGGNKSDNLLIEDEDGSFIPAAGKLMKLLTVIAFGQPGHVLYRIIVYCFQISNSGIIFSFLYFSY